ncbi:MAG: type II toxin-antitoxin system VapC family toxin [Verrucomicrobiota bacterium]
MSGCLLDTNIVSELRKEGRADSGLMAWFEVEPEEGMFLSVVTLGEIRKGIERLRPRDSSQAHGLELWLGRLKKQFAGKLLPITPEISDRWGRMQRGRPLPIVDSLLGATAIEHDLTLVTRNETDFAGLGIRVLNPFSQSATKRR